MQFTEVVGQLNTINQLISGVKNKKLSHAILVAGKEGYGGLALAIALSAYLNCQNRSESDSCGYCSSCQKIKKLIHPDIHFSFPAISEEKTKSLSKNYLTPWREAVIENPYLSYFDWLMKLDAQNKQGNIPVEEGREIVKNLSLKAHDGLAKIQIIWMADYLKETGNTLLKIIEEPAPNTYFIILAQNTENILNTILSRTQIFLLSPLTPNDIAFSLEKKIGLTKEEAEKNSKIANGDFREALRISKYTENDHEEQFIYWLRLCYLSNLIDVYEHSEKLASKGREYQKDFFQYGIRIFRECLLYLNDLEMYSYINNTEKDFLSKFIKTLCAEQIEEFYNALNQASFLIEHNANAKIVFFNLSLQLVQIFKLKLISD